MLSTVVTPRSGHLIFCSRRQGEIEKNKHLVLCDVKLIILAIGWGLGGAEQKDKRLEERGQLSRNI
jgi:hypothetical protein